MKLSRALAIVATVAVIAMALPFLARESAPPPGFESATGPAGKVESASLETPFTMPTDKVSDFELLAGHSVVDSNPLATVDLGIELSGWVGDINGSGLGGIKIEIESHGFDGEEIVRAGFISNDRGEFSFDNIVPGRQYRLDIGPQGSFAGYSLDSFSTEDAQDLQKITLDRVELVDAEGMIVDSNHAPVADFELSVRSLRTQFPDRVVRSDSSGYFKLERFPAGELRIATSAADYYRIKGLKLRPDEYRNLTLVIDRGNYHLFGWVSNDDGAPLAQARVTLKSAFATDEYHSFSYRSTVTDNNGGFEFPRLGGHKLTLGVYATGFSTHISQHEFKSFTDSITIRLRQEE